MAVRGGGGVQAVNNVHSHFSLSLESLREEDGVKGGATYL